MYTISPQQYKIAKDIGVKIFPSDKKKYKIDIYDADGVYYTSIGDKNYNDYFIYLSTSKELAEKHRKAYLSRHKKELLSIGSRGWWSAILLWDYHP
jgi:hypothetical protein